jgi:hypothetical protein
VTTLPVIASIPWSGVWFLRFVLGFLVHLGQGGRITDRVTGKVVGNPDGHELNFDHLSGGPLLWAPRLVGPDHLFIGHAVCPGFARIADRIPWWSGTSFCAPGFDYFHDGTDCGEVPVDLAPHAYAAVSVAAMEAAAWSEAAQRAVLVYPDPIDQAAFYFKYCQGHLHPAHNRLSGRRLADWEFRDYLLEHALPSYAKVFASYQAMAEARPGSVSIVPHRQLLERPARTMASVLSHLAGEQRQWPMIDEAVDLARHEHLVAVQSEMGPIDHGSLLDKLGAGDRYEDIMGEPLDPRLHSQALALLASRGIDPAHFGRLPAPVPAATERPGLRSPRNRNDIDAVAREVVRDRRHRPARLRNARGGSRTIFDVVVATHHKTGTVWMASVFKAIARKLRMNYVDFWENYGRLEPLLKAPFVVFNYDSKFLQHAALLRREDVRILHLIRDPRDVLISAMHYHKSSDEPWLHEPAPPSNDDTYQRRLNSFPTAFEQYMFELENSTGRTIQDMLDWQYGRGNCMDVRYEDLFQDRAMALWTSIVRFLGFDEHELEHCRECFWSHSLFGEAPGANRRHARSGEVAQWKREFTPELAQAFIDRFPDALQMLGYEADDGWVGRLALARTGD